MIHSTLKFGVVTFWSTKRSSRACLAERLEPLGLLKYLPEAITPLKALYAALCEQFPANLIRGLKGKGYAVVAEQVGEDDNSYATVLTAKLEGDQLRLSVADAEIADKLEQAYGEHKGMLTPQAIGTMLADICRAQLNATPLRPTGGIYWFDNSGAALWEKIASAVEACNAASKVYMIRHDLDTDSIRAVQDSLVGEISGEVRRLTADIESGALGERGLKTREQDARNLAEKVARYESILGVTLDAIKTQLADVETAAATAMFMGLGGADAPLLSFMTA